MQCAFCHHPVKPTANYCSRCGAAVRATARCASCDQVVDESDHFCDRCGARLRAAEAAAGVAAKAPGPDVAGRGVTIEVDLPTPPGADPDFETFVQTTPGAQQVDGPEGPAVRVTFGPADTLQLIAFVERTERRRGRRVYRDGQRQPWDEFFRFLECYRARRKSTNPDEYCFYDENNNPNVWGCFQVGMPVSSVAHRTEWLSAGKFDTDGSFVFDKKQLITMLDERLAPFRLCPALEVRHVGQALRAFPVRVNPKLNRDWRYVEDETGTDPGAVTALKREAGAAVEVRVRGVLPSNSEAAERTAQAVRRAVTAAPAGAAAPGEPPEPSTAPAQRSA